MRQNSKKIDNLISKVLKETLEERADDITSKLKSDINELGGMTPDSQDEEHPFYRVNFATMSREDIEDLLKKHYGRGLDDEEEEEEDFEDMKGEMEEGFDSEEISRFRKRKDFDPNEFEEIPLGKGKVGFPDESEMDDYTGSHPGRFVMNQIKRRLRDLEGEDEGEFTEGKEGMCEQCGSSSVNEGECKECGYKMEGIYDVYDLDDDNEFDYVQEEEDMEMEDGSNMDSELEKRIERFCHSEEKDKSHCEDLMKMKANMKGGEMTEKLHGNQDRLDHNKNGRIDSEDLRMAREKRKKRETDEEVEEGNLFSGKRADAIEKGEKEFEVDGKTYPVKESVKKCKVCGMKNCKCKHKKDIKEKLKGKGKVTVKESVTLSEEQMVDLIEKVVLEQKEKLKSIGKPRGLQKYQQAHEKSGKENKDYLKSVDKKMKDYLKDGSKGDYSMEPKMFPKGNGQLAKMKAKKYTMSDDGKEFLDDYMRPGMESLVSDEIQFDENWVSDGIEGSSRTGNNPEWANAEETDLGKKINKKRKDQKYHKAKMAAYRKSKQPVTDGTGEMAGEGVNIKLESTNPKQEKVLNEEFDRMKNLIGYNRKTQ